MPSPEFEKAATEVKNLTKTPTNDELLELYALYKQTTAGDNDTAKPGAFDFKNKYKWEAWEKKKGQAKEEAQKEYITHVDKLKEKYGLSE